MQTIKDLIALLTLKKINDTLFEGENYQAAWGVVFGGQVLGQSLHAAYQTVPEDRIVHSMHGYFISGGELQYPIRYEVDTIRDGGSFTTRRVVAKQNERVIFIMSASFQIKTQGVDHQIAMPNLVPPEKLANRMEQLEEVKETFPKFYQLLKSYETNAFDFKPVENTTSQPNNNVAPLQHTWLRSNEKINIDLRMQHQLLAYVSDYNLLNTATLAHREVFSKGKTFFASLDHTIRFHRDFDIQNWLLYRMESPNASNSRGFIRGSIFDQNGILIASVAQECLMRQESK